MTKREQQIEDFIQEISTKYTVESSLVRDIFLAGIKFERNSQSEYYLRISGVAMEGFYQYRGED